MIVLGGGVGADVQQVVAPAVSVWESIWAFVGAQLDLLPTWARVGLVVFAVVAAILSKWIIPALAEFARARGGGGDA